MKHPIHLICFVAISSASLRANEDLAAHKQFLNEHCGKCHTGKKPKGGFDLGSLSPGLSNSDSRRHWLSVLEQIETGEMPPESKPRPPATQVEALTTWIRKTAAQSANGRVVMRRLNRAEYANTVRDLLGVEIDLADLLPPDTSTNGFDNNAESLHTSSYLLRSYLDAADQKLHQPEVLRQQVERLLKDPKAAAFTREFTGQWLSLRAIDATMPDRTLYSEYDDSLKTAMLKETNLFFNELLTRDLPLTNFVASDFTFLNERLAKHYGIPGVEGMEMQRVNLPAGSHRGGVMTMGSVLKVTANGTTTSPVLRGSWVLERILGTPPAKPPVDVEAIEPDIRGATTIREQLAKHRDVEAYAGCHKKIDPPGFALESFDVIGGWREHYRSLTNNGERDSQGRRVRPGPAVDPADALTNGRRFQNIDEFKQLLLTDKNQLARNLAEKLLAYATGSEPTPLDRPQIDVIVKRVSEQGMGFRTLIHEIVQSALFQTK